MQTDCYDFDNEEYDEKKNCILCAFVVVPSTDCRCAYILVSQCWMCKKDSLRFVAFFFYSTFLNNLLNVQKKCKTLEHFTHYIEMHKHKRINAYSMHIYVLHRSGAWCRLCVCVLAVVWWEKKGKDVVISMCCDDKEENSSECHRIRCNRKRKRSRVRKIRYAHKHGDTANEITKKKRIEVRRRDVSG